MIPDLLDVQSHYETFLARNYLWMAGGWESGCERNRRFFATHGIVPAHGGTAIDLGAGCGFQSVPLARAGFHVVAVEFSRHMLAILEEKAGDLPIEPVPGDICSSGNWTGRGPELITCMGDTITHLPDPGSVRDLVRQCARDLVPAGRCIITFRDYSKEPAGTVQVIPVQRDTGRIFLCRLFYDTGHVRVTDILYTQKSGIWERSESTCTKLRIAPEWLRAIMIEEGLVMQEPVAEAGMVTLIGMKGINRA